MKCIKTRLAAGLCPDPLGELTALPRPLAGFKGRGGKGRGKGKGEGRREGRGKGEEPSPSRKILAPPLVDRVKLLHIDVLHVRDCEISNCSY